MTMDEKDALASAVREVEAIEALLEAVADKCSDPTAVFCLRGLETLTSMLRQQLVAIRNG